MTRKSCPSFLAAVGLAIACLLPSARAFVHPGGLHTQADLDRMKTQVAAGAHPWIDGWNALITDGLAQNTYAAAPNANMGVSRQRADKDAHAAYLNAIRWYVSGDTSYAECSLRILNGWSAAVNQVPTGTDIPGLMGIAVMDFALAGEVMRIYPGWAAADFARFQTMMTTYLYPVCHDFLTNHNGTCISHYWANWDICNTGALIAMGVLCDNTTIYNEGVTYFQSGAGNGSIGNAVYFLHPGDSAHPYGLGQWQESGRDQSHGGLGVGMISYACQVAWNQGLDLFGYSANRLLAGAEYVAQSTLWAGGVPYAAYNNCDNVNQYFLSSNALGGFGDRPVYELLYNHYAVRKALSAPNVKAMAQVMRPEGGSIDHFGYGTLMFTLDAVASPFPATPVPPTPANLTATPGTGRVFLSWSSAGGSTQGYTIWRATTSGGPYASISSGSGNDNPKYTDTGVANGTTYYYVVSARNAIGSSANSAEVSATPAASGALPAGWIDADIGTVDAIGSATFAAVSGGTFTVVGQGSGIGGTADSCNLAYQTVTGDFTIVARVASISGTLSKTGLMMRESSDPAAPTLVVKMGDAGWREAGFGTRSTAAGNMTWAAGNAYTWVPAWFRLQRSGNTFTASQSNDGATWSTVGTSTVAMASTYLVGLVASSADVTTFNTDTTMFDNVTLGAAPPALPAAPSALAVSTVSSSQVSLAWTNNATNQTGFKIERSIDNVQFYEIASVGAGATSFASTGLSASTVYYYRVRACNTGGSSAPSNVASAVMPTPTIPAAPTALVATAGNTLVALTWTGSFDAATYNVKRATVSGGPYTTVATGVQFAKYSDPGLTNGTTYYYVVSAVSAGGESASSAPASATPVDFVGYWKFDETAGTVAADSAGTNNGTLSATGATWVAGKIGNAVSLASASAGNVSLPIGGVIGALNDFTVAGWVNLATNVAWARCFDFGASTTKYMFLAPQSGSNAIRFAITTSGGAGEQQINGTAIPTTGVWHHVAVTLSGAVGTLYVDGAVVGTNSAMTLKPSSLGVTPNNWIGRSQFTADPYLNGSVDDFRIYARALSAAEISALANPAATPPAPTGLTATAGNAQVALSWTASAGATSYNVKRATASGGPYATIASGVTTTSSTDTTVTNGTPYYYVVSAVNANGESANSAQASATPQAPQPPAAPTGLTATAGNAQVALSWTASTGATSYLVKRATVSGGPYTVIGVTSPTNLTDTTVTNGTTYYYIVTASNAAGESASSAQVSATPQVPPPPAAPTGLTATAGNAQVALSWTASTGATSYNVKRATVSGGPYTAIATGVTATSYTDATAANGTTYYYVVSAVSANGESANSAQVSATPSAPTLPAIPSGLAATPGKKKVTLNWTASTGATSYNVKRATVSGGPYATIATGVTVTTYANTGLSPGTTYYFVVSAVNAAGESPNSSQASATPN